MKDLKYNNLEELSFLELNELNGGDEITEAIVRAIGWLGAALQDGARWTFINSANDPSISGFM